MSAAKSYSKNVQYAIKVLESHLEEHGWNFLRLTEDPVYSLKYRGDNGLITCTAKILTQSEQFFFEATPDFVVPDDRVSSILELITRANYSLTNGAFTFSFEAGRVFFKDSIIFEGIKLQEHQVGVVISIVIQTMDMYIPALIDVVEARKTPEEAFSSLDEELLQD